MSSKTLQSRILEIEAQVRDVTDYWCSRGDTMPMRAQVEEQTRQVLHALALRGWVVSRAGADQGEGDQGQ